MLRATTAAVPAVLLVMSCAIASAQAERADGTYTAKYVVLKAENDSVSMANDYWEKPATVIIAKGAATVRMTVNHSKWVTQFKVPGSGGAYVDTKVIETDKKQDKRVVEFKAADLDQPILAKIHVTVEEIDYDHDYTIRMVFDADSFKLIKAAEQPKPSPTPAAPTPTPAATAEPAPTVSPAQSAEAPTASATPTPASTASAGQPRPNETAAAQILAAPPSASPAATASLSPQPSPTAAAESAAPSASPSAEPSGQSAVAGRSGSSDDGAKADVKIAAAASGEHALETAAQAAAPADANDDASGSRIGWLIGIAAVLVAVGGGLYARKAMRGR